MDVNENLQQKNTFNGGMNTDTSDLYIPSNQYRMAKNLRLTSSGGSNQGELHLIEGNKLQTLTDYNANPVEFEEILATTSVAEYGVIVSKETINIERNEYRFSFGYGTQFPDFTNPKSVYITYYSNNDSPLVDQLIITIRATVRPTSGTALTEITKVVMYDPGDFEPGEMKEVAIVQQNQDLIVYKANIESCQISGNNTYIFRYITPDYDLFNQTFNGSDPTAEAFSIWRFTEKENSCRRIFGPCQQDIWSVGVDLTTKYENANDIKLYILTGIKPVLQLDLVKDEYEQYDFKPGTSFGDLYKNTSLVLKPVTLSLIGDGHVPIAKLQYAYRYHDGNGQYSQLSPLSKIISVYKDNSSGFSSTSDKSIDISIPKIDANAYTKIQIFRIQPDTETPQVYEVYNGEIIPQYTDRGGGNPVEGFANYYNLLANSSIPTVFSSKGGAIYSDGTETLSGSRLYEANIKDITSGIDLTFKNVDTRSFSSGMYFMRDGVKKYILDDQGNIVNKPEAEDDLFHEAFNGNTYGEYNPLYWKASSDKYGGTGDWFDWEYTYKQVSVNDIDQASTINDQITTFKYGEVYRFGVILYDLDGNRSSVKWIADIQMPKQPIDYAQYDSDNSYIIGGGDFPGKRKVSYKIKIVGINFKLKHKIPNCSQFEIVRCIRNKYDDTYNISQGIVGYPVKTIERKDGVDQDVSYENVANPIFPYGPISLQPVALHMCEAGTLRRPESIEDFGFWANNVYAFTYKGVVQFASPEYIYGVNNNVNQFAEYAPEGKNNKNLRLKLVNSYTIDSKDYNTIQFTLSGKHPTFLNSGRTTYVHSEGLQNDLGDNKELQLYVSDKRYPSINVGVFKQYNDSVVSKDDNIEIKEIQYPQVPAYNEFFNEESKSFQFEKNAKPIDGKSFVLWSSFFTQKIANREIEWDNEKKSKALSGFWNLLDDDWPISSGAGYYRLASSGAYAYPVGSTGKCMLLAINPGDIKITPQTSYPLTITVANIIKPANPYHGYNTASINNSSYYGFGDVFGNNPNQDLNIFSGDAYIKMFKYNAMHNIASLYMRNAYTASFIYCVPVLSEIDFQGQYGTIYNSNINSDDACLLQDIPSNVPKQWTITKTENGENQSTPYYFNQTGFAYQYNKKYSSLYYALAISPTSRLSKTDASNISRVIYSGADRWDSDTFLPSNYIDVDPQYGEITCLAAYKDKLIFWQQHAVGYMSINERAAISDINQNTISLGTGDLLKKPFYLSNVNGMKPHQLCYCITADNLYWWDGYNKEILRFNERGGVQPLSKTKTVQQYLSSNVENEKPHMYYDASNNEVICSCVNKESIVFNELSDIFTSIYTFEPKYNIYIHDKHYSLNKNNLYLDNTNYEGGRSQLFGIDAVPYLKYIVNKQQQIKTFNIISFGGKFYGGSEETTNDINIYQNLQHAGQNNSPLHVIDFIFKTPLKQEGRLNGKRITNREYDFRAAIPRAGKLINNSWIESSYGDRLRGRTMECELKSSSNSTDFSIQYINTKFNISCS